MTDDILAQAEVLLKNQPKWRITASEDAEDIKTLIELMPQLLAEAKRLEEERDALFEQGQKMIATGLSAIEEALAIALKMAQDRDAWKAKAIVERAKKNMDDRGPNGECRAHVEIQIAGYPRCVMCKDTGNMEDCPMLGRFLEQAARELEEEMRNE